MTTMWKTIIQPRMDYCSQLWSPDDQLSSNSIEAVQHHFLAKVTEAQLVLPRETPREIHDDIYLEDQSRTGSWI